MRGILKSTGEEVELYRIWGGRWQNPDKTEYYDIDDVVLENVTDNCYLENPGDTDDDDKLFVARDESDFVYLCQGDIWKDSDSSDKLSYTALYLGYGPEVFPKLKIGECKPVKMYLEIND